MVKTKLHWQFTDEWQTEIVYKLDYTNTILLIIPGTMIELKNKNKYE